MSETLHIKNMVCRRCVMAVEDICSDLGIAGAKVSLGAVSTPAPIDAHTLEALEERLRAVGFELIRGGDMVLLEHVKAAIRHHARHGGECKFKLSACIENAVEADFRHVSRLFSDAEGRTLENYLMLQRIEYVKELLFDGQMPLAEIADKARFSSVAHLSRAFKRIQGITITEFRAIGTRKPLDEV